MRIENFELALSLPARYDVSRKVVFEFMTERDGYVTKNRKTIRINTELLTTEGSQRKLDQLKSPFFYFKTKPVKKSFHIDTFNGLTAADIVILVTLHEISHLVLCHKFGLDNPDNEFEAWAWALVEFRKVDDKNRC